MSADREAVSDGGPVVSRTRRPVSDRVPRRAPCLRFDRCATTPETRPLPAVLRAHPPAMSTDCPVASDGRFSGPPSRGPIGHYASPVALPL